MYSFLSFILQALPLLTQVPWPRGVRAGEVDGKKT